MSEFIAKACINLRPEAGVSIDENGVHWHNIDQSEIPSETEIEKEAARLKAEFDAGAYRRKRAAEYPPIGDQLDALWKGGAAAEEMLAAVMAVKAKYPKG